MELPQSLVPRIWTRIDRRGFCPTTFVQGLHVAGSFADANIEKMSSWVGLKDHSKPRFAVVLSTEVKHVLVCSGFYVHNYGGNEGQQDGIQAGSCETDGPLGALALVRAFASRGVYVSLYVATTAPCWLGTKLYCATMTRRRRQWPLPSDHSRCLADATDGAAEASAEFLLHTQGFAPMTRCRRPSLRSRAARSSFELGGSQPWQGERMFPLSTLFSPSSASPLLIATFVAPTSACIRSHRCPLALIPPAEGSKASASMAAFASRTEPCVTGRPAQVGHRCAERCALESAMRQRGRMGKITASMK